MSDSDGRPILSRLSAGEFVGRETELQRIERLCGEKRRSNSILLGPPRVGKSEILRQSYDRLFAAGGETLPTYFSFNKSRLESRSLARDYLARFLAQLIAFRRDDPGVMRLAGGPLEPIGSAAAAEDYPWIKELIESFARAEERPDAAAAVRCALGAAQACGWHSGITPFVMLDNVDLLADPEAAPFFAELIPALAGSLGSASSRAPSYLLCGLRRPM